MNKLNPHLVETHHGMKSCNKVNEDVMLEYKEAFTNYHEQKSKQRKYSKKLVQVQMRVPFLKQQEHWGVGAGV